MILEKTIRKASLILKNSNIESHELDAEIILSNIMGVTKEFIITNNKSPHSFAFVKYSKWPLCRGLKYPETIIAFFFILYSLMRFKIY